MPVESVTYAELGTRLTISTKAARALAKRLRLPRSLSDDGKPSVIVDIAELRHTPRPGRRKGHVVLAAKVLALEAEIGRLETAAAGHRADFERERERADQLMVELPRRRRRGSKVFCGQPMVDLLARATVPDWVNAGRVPSPRTW
jgi:hypothetical protein